jgi:hypothetical protein
MTDRVTERGWLFGAEIDGIAVLPVLHERLEAADLVRLALEVHEPDAVAVEVPSSLERTWLKAVDRLPSISVLLYETARDETIYLPVHPADPMVEAARCARERGLAFACADLDVDGYGDWRDPIPDPYTVLRLGPGRVLEAFRAAGRREDPLDGRREASMAFHARRLSEGGARRVLLVCGMHHVDGVARALAMPQAIPLTPPVRRNVRLVHLHPESLGEVLGEIPFYAAAQEARRQGLPDLSPEPPAEPAGRWYGPFRVISGGRGDEPERLVSAVTRSAHRGGIARWPFAPAAAGAAPGPLDRLRLQWALLREAERALGAVAPDETVEPWQRRNFARFSRNLARASGVVLADLYDLIVAARGCVSENFAFELHRLATAYPWQHAAAADLPTARIRADELHYGVRRIRLTRRLPRLKQRRPESLLRRRRLDERYPGEWLEGFDEASLCSFPPEDLVVEEFGRYLRRRGRSVLSEERSRSVPFTTSLLDGIDVRETVRHWSERTLYVRELGRVPGEVAAVVVIFDEDREGEERYPYRLTWLGEHEQESDMALYATDPPRAIVGPGICRATYGGFLLSYPPGRLMDVWADPDYRLAETKPEVLLLAALDYSRERIVVHVAARPPRSIFHQIAARLGRRILHLPLGSLSPATLRRIRVLHILSGHAKREIAKQYIW